MDFIKGQTVNLLVKVMCNPVMECISVKPIGKGFAFNPDSNALCAVGCIPLMECTMVKQILKSFKSVVSQMTRNGSMRRFACLEAA